MEFVVGTSSGMFLGANHEALHGTEGVGIRQLRLVAGDLFAGTTDGVRRSANRGRTWERAGVDGSDVWEVLASPDDPGTLYAGTQPAHFFRSCNGGATWERFDSFLGVEGADCFCLPGGQTARALTLVVDPFEPNHVLAGVEVGGILNSHDGGKTWSLGLAGGNADIHILTPHPKRPGVVFATTGHGRNDDLQMNPREAGLYRSEDGGQNWTYLGTKMNPYYTRPICIDPRPPHAITLPTAPEVRSSIKDPGGANAALFRSDDDGDTWRDLGDAEHTPSAARLTAVTAAPNQAGWVLVGTETGEVWHVSPDAAWTKLTEALPPVQALLALS